MGPPLKAAENRDLPRLLALFPRASMGPPLKAAENQCKVDQDNGTT